MRYQVDTLSGATLDLAVALTEGLNAEIKNGECYAPEQMEYWDYTYSPSANWAHGGPIIEQERIEIEWRTHDTCCALSPWNMPRNETSAANGPTPLIAAMRCYVKSRHGEYIDLDVPEGV